MAISKRIRKVVTGDPKVINTDMGVPGDPINKSHPFYFGFIATIGALTAFVLMRALASASQIFVLILIALFLATGLNPAVEALRRRGLSRTNAVTTIFVSVILFVIFFALIVVPPVISQGSHLISDAPSLIQGLKSNSLFTRLNEQYGLLDTLQKEISARTSNGKLLLTTFGGVVGVGKSVLSGTFSALTILVLTLYFLTSLPQMIQLGLRLTPASRRPRIGALTEAIIARVGSFVSSQVTIAFLAGGFTFFLSLILGIPSPIALGMTVFVCGLIPLIGHFIGCTVFTLVAFTQSITVGAIAFLAYVLYVQVENYLITPRIMKKALSVPGAVTIISALIGSSLLGLIGGLLAVPVAASIILILDEVVFPRTDGA
jgi:predicted PurR-regulated permease PerM